MPYAPGVQDVSGQLLAEGMRARSQGIAGGLVDWVKGYDQNQALKRQALSQFAGATAADPDILKFLQTAQQGQTQGDPNAPKVPPEVLKAFANIQKGDVDVYDASILGTFAGTYQRTKNEAQQRQLMQAQAAKTQIEAMQAMAPQQRGNIMRFADVAQQYPVDKFDINAVPVAGQPGLVDVKSISPRAPVEDRVTAQVAGNEIVVLNQKGEPINRIPFSSAIPQGYEAAAGGGIRPIAGGPVAKEEAEKAEKQRMSAGMAQAMSANLNSAIDRAVARVSPQTAGAGSYLSLIPGSQARNLEGDLDQIKAIIGFDQLAKMRAASPTGGALGQVAVRELDFLQSVLGKLDQKKDYQELRRTLLEVKNSMNKLNLVMQGRNPDEEEKAAGGKAQAAAPANETAEQMFARLKSGKK